ncbi:MAG: 6-pyruvoyl trahydropterin synthase family protein, partial [Candidatus Kariarchaeaceae archaeon]
NLDELKDMQDQLTTTEFLAKYIWDKMRSQLQILEDKPTHIDRLKITLYESSVASAGYDSTLEL